MNLKKWVILIFLNFYVFIYFILFSPNDFMKHLINYRHMSFATISCVQEERVENGNNLCQFIGIEVP